MYDSWCHGFKNNSDMTCQAKLSSLD